MCIRPVTIYCIKTGSLYFVNVRSEPLLAVGYESQAHTAILSEQLSKEGREFKRGENLNTRGVRHARAVLHVICLLFPPAP
jgi:hypothetical protein